ncbi:MAG TPA: hypothetical protein VFS55_03390 [Dokdonella sp.]|nr:hypothetical protein [Dokdonella sp.]
MNTRSYVVVSASVFGLVALVHAVRLFQGWPAQLGPFTIPPAASWLAAAVTASLSVAGFASLRR